MLGYTQAPIIFVTIAIASAVVTASAPLSELAAMDVSLVLSGEYWRLLSGHLTHITWCQYFTDAICFVVLAVTCSRCNGLGATLLLTFFSALGVSLTVILSGRYQVYAGLSGINCAALAAIVANRIIHHPQRKIYWAITAIYGAYLLNGESVIVNGVRVVSEAHIAGAAIGLIFFILQRYCWFENNPCG